MIQQNDQNLDVQTKLLRTAESEKQALDVPPLAKGRSAKLPPRHEPIEGTIMFLFNPPRTRR